MKVCRFSGWSGLLIESNTFPVTASSRKRWKRFVSANLWSNALRPAAKAPFITYWDRLRLDGICFALSFSFLGVKDFQLRPGR